MQGLPSNQVVLTPALLPGLIGMGVAAWRKRRAEAQPEVSEQA
ncbi:MAG TPA: PTPA-CTERM sorting domain-containing protein [Coleofasciculaceae cyanobacterium]